MLHFGGGALLGVLPGDKMFQAQRLNSRFSRPVIKTVLTVLRDMLSLMFVMHLTAMTMLLPLALFFFLHSRASDQALSVIEV